jgi:hypothetical protein
VASTHTTIGRTVPDEPAVPDNVTESTPSTGTTDGSSESFNENNTRQTTSPVPAQEVKDRLADCNPWDSFLGVKFPGNKLSI